MRIESDHILTKMRRSLSTFMALYSRRLWHRVCALRRENEAVQPLKSIRIHTVSQNDPTKKWPRRRQYNELLFLSHQRIYLRVLFFARISALMPSNQLYHSFSCKICVNPRCNSVCSTENVVCYMPRQWHFKGLPNNLPSWRRNQRMFYGVKSSRRTFSKYL